MVNREQLEQLHASGFNCAQCVAAYFADRCGIDKTTALAATGGFGGGFRAGGVCGAAAGAVMVLGLKYPYDDGANQESKEEIMLKTQEFNERFTERYSFLDCRDLKEKGPASCDELIFGAAEIVDEMLSK